MGRNNRSRKRRDEMNKIKKDRYDAKELIRLKKTLGLLDADGKEIKMEIAEVAEIKTSKEIKRVSCRSGKILEHALKDSSIGCQIKRRARTNIRASGEPRERPTCCAGQWEIRPGARLQQQNTERSIRQLSRVVQKEEDCQASTQEAACTEKELQTGLDNGECAALETGHAASPSW